MTLIDVLLIILIISASALCIYSIIFIKRLLKEVETIRSDVHNFINKADPVLDNLADVTQRANKIVSEAENYWDEIDNSIKKLKEKVSDLTSLRMFRDADNPTSDLIRNIKALIKGASAFWHAFKRY
ncbi:MAG: hypothetical protein AB1521_08020 [Bacteroidota bacterium]